MSEVCKSMSTSRAHIALHRHTLNYHSIAQGGRPFETGVRIFIKTISLDFFCFSLTAGPAVGAASVSQKSPSARSHKTPHDSLQGNCDFTTGLFLEGYRRWSLRQPDLKMKLVALFGRFPDCQSSSNQYIWLWWNSQPESHHSNYATQEEFNQILIDFSINSHWKVLWNGQKSTLFLHQPELPKQNTRKKKLYRRKKHKLSGKKLNIAQQKRREKPERSWTVRRATRQRIIPVQGGSNHHFLPRNSERHTGRIAFQNGRGGNHYWTVFLLRRENKLQDTACRSGLVTNFRR